MTTTAAVDPRGVTPSKLVAREIRAELGRQQLSNRRFAMMLGVSPMWVNRRLSLCDTDLTVEDIRNMAEALHVPVQRLIAGWVQLPPLDSNQQPAGHSARVLSLVA